jgi:hypothetical protein
MGAIHCHRRTNTHSLQQYSLLVIVQSLSILRWVGIVLDFHVRILDRLPQAFLQVHVQHRHLVVCLLDEFLHLAALAQFLHHLRVVPVRGRHLDAVPGDLLHVDPVLRCGGEVAGGHPVQEGLVLGDDLGACVGIGGKANLKKVHPLFHQGIMREWTEYDQRTRTMRATEKYSQTELHQKGITKSD